MKPVLIILLSLAAICIAGCQKEDLTPYNIVTNGRDPFDTAAAVIPIDTLPPVVITCDTVGVTYTANISSIIQQNCVSCHNTSGSSASDNLTTYTALKSEIQSDGTTTFMRRINHTGGSYMPPSYKLSSCQIRQLDIWIATGMPQ